jgi:hypothetical protein
MFIIALYVRPLVCGTRNDIILLAYQDTYLAPLLQTTRHLRHSLQVPSQVLVTRRLPTSADVHCIADLCHKTDCSNFDQLTVSCSPFVNVQLLG